MINLTEVAPRIVDAVDTLIQQFSGPPYETAEAIRDAAQAVMEREKPARVSELRRLIEEGEAAAKELADLKPVGRPREPRQRKQRQSKNGAEVTA